MFRIIEPIAKVVYQFFFCFNFNRFLIYLYGVNFNSSYNIAGCSITFVYFKFKIYFYEKANIVNFYAKPVWNFKGIGGGPPWFLQVDLI